MKTYKVSVEMLGFSPISLTVESMSKREAMITAIKSFQLSNDIDDGDAEEDELLKLYAPEIKQIKK